MIYEASHRQNATLAARHISQDESYKYGEAQNNKKMFTKIRA